MGMNLVITVDIDNDGAQSNERTSLSWKAIEYVPRIKELFDSFNLCVTWFVRADNQLLDIYGTAAYLLLKHQSLWSQMESAGDELAWHPHLYKWCEAGQQYICEPDDLERVQKLNDTYGELKSKGFEFPTVRIGEAFHSNAMLEALEMLSLKVDATAIPGRKRSDEARQFDWEPTPNEPYYPSKIDYRIPDPTNQRNILEVPMTTIPVKADYDNEYLPRYINPTFFHPYFKEGIDHHLASRLNTMGEQFLTIVMHPDEVADTPRAHSLYSFSFAEMRKNIAYLLETLKVRGFEYRALRVRDVLPRFCDK